ncbi:MAG: hypothetical protein LUC83_09885 [Clostridiales bacterium]|nr:hypothetical protein [Clostridiales bacterium]
MAQKKSLGFGARGWMLIFVMFSGMVAFMVFRNYPVNILSDFYGGATVTAMLSTIGSIVGVVIQLTLSRLFGRIKSVKRLTCVIGIIAIACAYAQCAIPIDMSIGQCSMLRLWQVLFFIECVSVTTYGVFLLSVLAGQWFPRRKGTVMGIATIAFPFSNGVIGLFATSAMSPLETGNAPAVFKSFLPFLILATVGFIVFIFGLTDYPEQVGAFRDNDRSMTPEVAKAMMEEEIENKRTTVWTAKHILSCREMWFASIYCGLLLIGSSGVMTQSSAIVGAFEGLNYTLVMMGVAVAGALGSYAIGLLDTAFGTKKAMIIGMCLMVIAGILGVAAVASGAGAPLAAAMIFIALYMGASSNFSVSVSAQYWRREDFPSVFGVINPISNIFEAAGPTIIITLIGTGGASVILGVRSVFVFLTIIGIIGVVLISCFSKNHIRKLDDKYRAEAGKPLDDALGDRK